MTERGPRGVGALGQRRAALALLPITHHPSPRIACHTFSHLDLGQASGAVPPFDTSILNAKGSLSLARPSLTHNVASHADVLWRAGDLFKWLAEGNLTANIGGIYRLSQAADAHRQLESRKSTGKILLVP